jgi:hypothetical protein|tara:strand:- start:240 stop:434 length:195 start_codon:yes stop_codon:yes gene_type:complete
MKLIGQILIALGVIDFILSWLSDDWNIFVYNLVGEDLMQFTAIILFVIGSIISKMGSDEQVNEE